MSLSEDKLKVCRNTPLIEKENEDECTIYVERLPDDTQLDWLKNIFSSFGIIDYISLPRYKHTKRLKGFAFIEFHNPDSAAKALAHFDSIGCKLPIQMPPNQLASILTFDKDNIDPKEKQKEQTQEQNKSEEKEENETKEVKKEDSEENKKIKKKKRKVPVEESESDSGTKKIKLDENPTEGDDTEDAGEKMEEDIKKKRKRKKSKKKECDFKQLGLQVLSK